MAISTLAHEKVWVDKSSYDKAERIHYEKLAKVLPFKNMDNSNASASIKLQTTLLNTSTTSKSKSKKGKDNKIPSQDNIVIDSSKNSKNSKKNIKKKEESTPENVKIIEIADSSGLKIEDSNVGNAPVSAKKLKAKEAKEKKNKADKKQRILEEDKCSNQEKKLSQESQPSICSISPAGGSLANEVAKARQHIKQSLQCMDGIEALAGVSDKDLASRVVAVEKENQELRNIVQELKSFVSKLEGRVGDLEGRASIPAPVLAICPQKPASIQIQDESSDQDVDLFGSDSEGEDAAAAKIREERLAAYAAKKSKKPVLIAKSNIILDVKPWDDETDMKVLEAEVRKIETDGLLWGAAKLVPVAFKILKLQISCVVEDDKVSVDWLTEQIEAIEEYVQSVDIAAFNKV